jgi:hypothetical protein
MPKTYATNDAHRRVACAFTPRARRVGDANRRAVDAWSVLASTLLMLRIIACISVFLTACGKDVPTCASDCQLVVSGESSSLGLPVCVATCQANQSTAAASDRAADFQLGLTCVGNAGGFSPLCYALLCGLTDAFGDVPGCKPVDSGVSSTDADGVDGSSCSNLQHDCCELLGGYCGYGDAGPLSGCHPHPEYPCPSSPGFTGTCCIQ